MNPIISIYNILNRFYHRLSSPREFYQISVRWMLLFSVIALFSIAYGSYLSLFVAPTDYQQCESYRILFVHVPAAWLSLFIFVTMAIASAIGMIWRIKMAFLVNICSAPIGAAFTFLTLVTGSLWGKPMWGTWWAWDARLTSELILLFLYFGVMALYYAFEERQTAEKAAAILAIVGVVIVPIIHYSVEWWSSLHQGATVFRDGGPAMPQSMLTPLIFMAIGFTFLYGAIVFQRMRTQVLRNEQNKQWVRELFDPKWSNGKKA